MKSAPGPGFCKHVLAILLMVGMLVSLPTMMLHGRAPAAQPDQHAGHHTHHHPASPGQNDCCEWCLSNCVAPAALPQAPTIAVLQIGAAAVATVAGPGRLCLVGPHLLPYPLGPPVSLSV